MFNRSSSVGAKALIVSALALLLCIPLTLLRGLVTERSTLRAAAYSKVAAGWGGRATVAGPILIVPTQRQVIRNGEPMWVESAALFLPTDLTYDIDLRVQDEHRRVGIYEVPVYIADVTVRGNTNTDVINRWQQAHTEEQLQWSKARVLLPLSDTHALRGVEAKYAGQTLTFVPGPTGDLRGVEAALALSQALGDAMRFEMKLLLAGSEGLALLPLGNTTSAKLTGNWPHPSFSGAFSPTRYAVDHQHFTADWNVLELNRNYGGAWLRGEVDTQQLLQSASGVDIFQSVDVYQRGERAIKYALVFIALTFLTFFAWEHITDVRLHPLQYLLLGLALSVFYLLLIALTEHIDFGLAYLVAALALVLLLGFYTAGALHSARRGFVVATALSITYGALYGLVIAEDYALLLGAIAVFTALAIVMLATRRIDWYALRSD